MRYRFSLQDDSIYSDMQGLSHTNLALYALESFANRVDSATDRELARKLILSHSEIAKRLEDAVEQLERSERQLEEAQRIAQIGRWDLDNKTGKAEWSKSLYLILGVDPTIEPTMELFLEFVYPEDRAFVSELSHKMLEAPDPESVRYRVVSADGAIRWVHVHLHTDFDADGTPSHSYGTLQDVTAMKEAEDELARYSKHLEEMVSDQVREISDAQMATIFALVKLAESRDDETGAHIERTANFCSLLAKKARALPQFAAEIDEAFIATIHRASPLHDIGKVGISDRILLKPGKLTPEEFEIMKSHVEIGHQTLKSVEKRYQNNSFIRMGLDITRYHHEKWDGSGYLAGLNGNEIPLAARIMALSDVYDALRSKRVYKEPFPHEKCVEIIKEGSGTHFDPTLTELFIRNAGAFEKLYDELTS